MSEMQWFSAKIRLACLIESKGAQDYMDSIYIFRSSDFDDAFKRAIDIGKSQEKSYLNVEHELVAWKLKEIVSLDVIQTETLDGAEVYSEPVRLLPNDSVPFDHEFHPEDSQPTQTV